MKKKARIAASSLTVAMLAFCAPSIASACEEAVRIAVPSPAQSVASAEKTLEVSPAESARVIAMRFPKIRSLRAGTVFDPLMIRALRVYAVATVRSSGKAEDLAWSVQTLREIEKVRANDPAVQADLGEALSKTASGKAEALAILAKLADKDLMGSPYAYAALAALKQEKGDAAGAQVAIDRCKQMSGSKTAASNTCKVIAAKA